RNVAGLAVAGLAVHRASVAEYREIDPIGAIEVIVAQQSNRQRIIIDVADLARIAVEVAGPVDVKLGLLGEHVGLFAQVALRLLVGLGSLNGVLCAERRCIGIGL